MDPHHLEEILEKNPVLVGCAVPPRADAPMVQELPLPKEPEHDVGVADVDREQHSYHEAVGCQLSAVRTDTIYPPEIADS